MTKCSRVLILESVKEKKVEHLKRIRLKPGPFISGARWKEKRHA